MWWTLKKEIMGSISKMDRLRINIIKENLIINSKAIYLFN